MAHKCFGSNKLVHARTKEFPRSTIANHVNRASNGSGSHTMRERFCTSVAAAKAKVACNHLVNHPFCTSAAKEPAVKREQHADDSLMGFQARAASENCFYSHPELESAGASSAPAAAAAVRSNASMSCTETVSSSNPKATVTWSCGVGCCAFARSHGTTASAATEHAVVTGNPRQPAPNRGVARI